MTEYKFWGKYGEWTEEHINEADAKLRAQALNVSVKKEVE